MSRKNTRKTSKKKDTAKKGIKENGDIKGIIYIALGVLLSIAIYTTWAGALSKISRDVIYNLIGVSAFVLPLYLIYFGYHIIVSKGSIKFTRRLFGFSMIIISITLFCATASINILGESIGFSEDWKAVFDQNGLNGGLLGHLISYPLSRLIGFIGSYILYATIVIIGVILSANITLYDIASGFKGKFNKSNKKVKNKEEKEIKDKESLIEVVPKVEDKEREDFISGINNKIKILDFMKNSSLEDSSMEIFKETDENKGSEENPFNIEVFNEEKKEREEVKAKKEKLDNNVKEVVSKEIEESLTEEKKEEKPYINPSIELLNINNKTKFKKEDKRDLLENASKLVGILNDFGVDANVKQVTKGPSVTRYEIQPSPGVKVSKIVNLQDDIALGLAASGVRMEAPIPGKAAIGIEVPNSEQTPVFLREVLDNKDFKESNNKIAFALGKDIAGKSVIGDIATMPHTLIAGATGSGKSVCINTLIVSLLYKYSPKEVRLLMVDPKVVELSIYNGIPHLLIPVVTDPKKAAAALNWAVNEMNKRYNLFSESSVRNIEGYNALFDKGMIEEKIPYMVIIVDELADLMMTCPNDVEDYICRLAQKARAAGIHLIIATQRPSVDVITGVIKANIPSRISFAVSSGIDSRTILDQTGAEKLLGRGDMLYCPMGENKPVRVQGAFISEEEVERVVNFIKDEGASIDYEKSIIEHIENESKGTDKGIESSDVDELLNEAIKIVVEYNQASTSFLQRKLRIGFNRASRIMDDLEERGIISEKDGSRPREVLISKEELELED
ncbi:MAG: DNA translocase FtsK 4TM domain-containing protein [Clostridium sp.]|uniref:FtsK/SpoIIIE family DNA translocase n=1 Tax=Clostridium sp. TaxID=1506 RepID=UPI00290E4552|nr:DNA translocase FtsK 4TM domain-containing protein [Clostridium sp.]MDU5111432.1 DNA translocase FtsK 4TM domain-containing protein [Clostridium sp.]